MWEKIKQFLASPVFPADEDKTRVARLLNSILWVIVFTALSGTTVVVLNQPSEAALYFVSGLLLVGVLLGVRVWLRRGYVWGVGWTLVAALWLRVTYVVFLSGSLRNQLMTVYYLILIVTGAVLGSGPALIIGGLNIIIGLVLYVGESRGWISGSSAVTASFAEWFIYTLTMTLSAVLLRMSLRDIQRWMRRSLESEKALSERNRELYESREKLVVYTRNIKRHLAYLEATARVTHTTGSLLESGVLLERLAQAITAELRFEHVGIYILTDDRMVAELKAASSEVGQRLVAQGYALTLADVRALEIVVWCGENYICRDEEQDGAFLNNPECADVHSALLLPLRQTRDGEVFGVLELATQRSEAFDAPDALVLQSLADQAALVIEQARVFAELQANLVVKQPTSEQAARESWTQLLRPKAGRVYHYMGEQMSASARGQRRSEAVVSETDLELTFPLRVRDQVLGKLVAHKFEERGDWTAEESAMMNTLLAQLEQALDSARLYDMTQRRAMRERVTRELTDYIRSSLTIEEAMRRALREVARVLRASEAVARIGGENILLQHQADVETGDVHE